MEARVRRRLDPPRDLRAQRRVLDGSRVKLSVVIPAHNESASIEATLADLAEVLDREEIEYELLVVDDSSSDGTLDVVERLSDDNPRIRGIPSHNPRGF